MCAQPSKAARVFHQPPLSPSATGKSGYLRVSLRYLAFHHFRRQRQNFTWWVSSSGFGSWLLAGRGSMSRNPRRDGSCPFRELVLGGPGSGLSTLPIRRPTLPPMRLDGRQRSVGRAATRRAFVALPLADVLACAGERTPSRLSRMNSPRRERCPTMRETRTRFRTGPTPQWLQRLSIQQRRARSRDQYDAGFGCSNVSEAVPPLRPESWHGIFLDVPGPWHKPDRHPCPNSSRRSD